MSRHLLLTTRTCRARNTDRTDITITTSLRNEIKLVFGDPNCTKVRLLGTSAAMWNVHWPPTRFIKVIFFKTLEIDILNWQMDRYSWTIFSQSCLMFAPALQTCSLRCNCVAVSQILWPDNCSIHLVETWTVSLQSCLGTHNGLWEE